MTLLRHVARPMLAAAFVSGGLDTLRDPDPRVTAADGVAPPIAARIPGLPEDDTEALVRINAGVQVGAGLLLGLGRLPRLSAALLAASLVPTTVAGHRFWEADEPTSRTSQRVHFVKNVSLFGGLVIAALDTEGRPGLRWRSRQAAHRAGAAGRRGRAQARREARHLSREARLTARAAGARVAR